MNPAIVSVSSGALPRDAAWRRHHIELLAGTLVVIALAAVCTVGADGGVRVLGCPGLKLPPLCGSRVFFGVDCPGCGLTRSFVLLAHGRWAEAIAAHRIGWLLALGLLAQVPYRLAALFSRRAFPLGIWTPRIFGWLLIVALVGNWLMQRRSR